MSEELDYWLVNDAGRRVRVDLGGALIGRDPLSAVSVDHEHVSRSQALVIPREGILELRHMGTNPTRVNGKEVGSSVGVADGDVIGLPGDRELRVMSAPGSRGTHWSLADGAGDTFAIRHTPFTVGGRDADLVLPGWPAEAVRLQLAQDALLFEGDGAIRLNGQTVDEEELVTLAKGDVVSFGDEELRVQVTVAAATYRTVHAPGRQLPDRIEVQLDEGDEKVILTFGDKTISVGLSRLRANLLAALIVRPKGFRPDDFIPNDLLIGRVWEEDKAGKGRGDLNLLIYWVRKILVEAGVDGNALIERAPRGRGTRLRLAQGAESAVR